MAVAKDEIWETALRDDDTTDADTTKLRFIVEKVVNESWPRGSSVATVQDVVYLRMTEPGALGVRRFVAESWMEHANSTWTKIS